MFSAYITSLHALSTAPSRVQNRFIALGLIGTTAVAYLGWASMTKTRVDKYAKVAAINKELGKLH